MIKLALCVFSYFKNDGIQLAFDPTNRSKLFWIIGSKIFVIGMRPDFLNFIKINTPFRIVFHEHAFVYIKFKPYHKKYNSYTSYFQEVGMLQDFKDLQEVMV